ncbi:MAG: hypothetical protein P8Z79_02135 [Sedimentisphaerales bacterium]|jgi:hypothetical protein
MKRLSVWFLIVTLALQVQAGVPEPKGLWEFNGIDPNSATIGAPLELVGSVQDTAGVNAEDGAMNIGEGSYYVCTHGIAPNGGGAKVNEWTLLIDLSYPPSSLSDPPSGYNDLFQTDPTNADDADWTIRSEGAIGIGAVGYSSAFGYTTQPDTWYRMVVVIDNGVRHDLYVDGVEIFKGNQQGVDGRFSLADTLLLFAAGYNQDGDDAPINVSTVAIWDVPLTADEILALGHAGQNSFGDYPQAAGPVPADGALHGDTWVNVSWRAGDFAVSHDVYLGDDYQAVDEATKDSDLFRGNQGETFYVAGFPGFAYPDGLVPGTTYYWRIDEVNDAHPDSPWEGEVWSFSIPPKTAYNPDPADGTESVGPEDVTLTWTPGYGAKLHTVYFGDDFDTVADAAEGAPSGTAMYKPGPLELEKVYYWRVDEFDAVDTYRGDVWRFSTPGAVGSPQPVLNGTDVAMNATLSWTPADSAASHQLYFGTDKEAVRAAGSGSPEDKGSIALGVESYDPGLLEADTIYYWRVDEVDSQGNTSKGPIWVFTTGAFLLVDDFESYTDDDGTGQAIWQTWIDGFGVADNGAQVGYLLPPYAEQTIVYGGSQSMPLQYTNEAGVTNSEAAMTLSAPRDWTQAGVAELSLWFRGAAGNAADPLYVGVSNSTGVPAILAQDDSNAATIRSWTQWRIPLQAFTDQGINLGNVDKIAIGVGSKGDAAVGGTGTVYIDDIRLYRATP